MKWVFYIIVFIYMAYRAVYGAKVTSEISVEKINYDNRGYLEAGTRLMINCRASNKNQHLEWLDPSDKVIKRASSNRVYTQEHFVSNSNGRVPALALVFTDLLVKDTGTYSCRSGDTLKQAPLCVVKSAEYVDTPVEVIAALGRSITLTCQARGDPEPHLVWMRNSEPIFEKNDTIKYKVNTKYNSQGFESLLTIMSLEPEDSGPYNCISVQEQPQEECFLNQLLNITLQVNHGPIFENNNTKAAYGKINDIVDLVCSANGYPAPTYRWFKAVDDDTLAEFDKNQIKYSEETNQAVLSVTAGPTTFGQTYKCLATNAYGETEKYFKLLKIQKPQKPNKVKSVGSTGSQIELNVSWYDEIDFPVEGFHVQYLNMKRKPKEFEWRKATVIEIEVDNDENAQLLGYNVTVEDLDEVTSYWLRVKPTNKAGDGAWSDPVLAETTEKIEEPDEVKEEIVESEDDLVTSDGVFYGIFFAGGIAVLAVICMFAMRMV